MSKVDLSQFTEEQIKQGFRHLAFKNFLDWETRRGFRGAGRKVTREAATLFSAYRPNWVEEALIKEGYTDNWVNEKFLVLQRGKQKYPNLYKYVFGEEKDE